jgi:low-density lipoprotein receptor-related protein 1 (alpha-2-macroglobulin receptor)
MYQRCDGEYDCHDQSDETSTCPSPKCVNSRSCFPMGASCDGKCDCADGSDEALYRDMFSHAHCKQSSITNLRLCDEDDDCEHGEDESNCSGPLSCPANLHILNAFTLCNGADDCVHATNELLCGSLDVSLLRT